jgi:hypothetical protein
MNTAYNTYNKIKSQINENKRKYLKSPTSNDNRSTTRHYKSTSYSKTKGLKNF